MVILFQNNQLCWEMESCRRNTSGLYYILFPLRNYELMRSNWLDCMLKLDYPFLFLVCGLTLRWTNHLQVAYTFDAGPNAVMIARNRKTAALLLQRLLYNFPPQSDTDLDRYTIFLPKWKMFLTVGISYKSDFYLFWLLTWY